MLDWIRILKSISDEEMKQICGTDAALYIIFVRYAAYLFAISAIFGFIVLVPIYATGDPEKPSLVYDETAGMKIALLLISIVNCTKIQAKVAVSFGIILIFYTSAIFFFIFLFWKRSLRWRFREMKQNHSYSDSEIAQQSIFISHLPQTVSMKVMKIRIQECFEKLFSPEKVVSVRVIPKMDDLLERGERLKINKEKLAYYKQKFEVTRIRPMVNQGGCCLCGRISVDAIDYFTMSVEKDTEYIRREKGNRAECNSGMAVVTFVSRLQVSRCLDNSDFRQLAIERLSPDELQQFYVLSWDIKKAPTQSEILWTNLQKGGFKSQIKSWFLLIILMIVCIILVTPVILLKKLVPLLEALEK